MPIGMPRRASMPLWPSAAGRDSQSKVFLSSGLKKPLYSGVASSSP